VVLAVAAAAGRKIRILIRSESGAQQREAEEGQQQDGREAPQAIILAHFESKPEAQRQMQTRTLIPVWRIGIADWA